MSDPAAEPESETPIEAPESVPEPTEPATAPEPDQESAEADVPLEEPPAPAGESEAQMKRNLAKLESEATRHANRISEIMGEAASVLEPCPRCADNLPGFIFPPELALPDPEQKSAVLASIGEGGAANLRKSEITRMCEHCEGEGQWLSGSKVPNLRIINCSYCSGKGYIGVGGPAPAVPVAAGNGQGAAEAAEPVPVADGSDIFGRPAGDRNWGMHPLHAR